MIGTPGHLSIEQVMAHLDMIRVRWIHTVAGIQKRQHDIVERVLRERDDAQQQTIRQQLEQ